MKRLSRMAVIVLAALGLAALSGIALAADDGDDTVFNYGYDEGSQFFMWNVTSLDYEPDYDALDETLGEGGTVAEDGLDALLEACGLAAPEGSEPLEYGYTFDGETIELFALTEGSFDPEVDEPVDVGECGELTGGYVTGPQGQVNHGMFLKLFNSVYDGPNRGCLVRHIAQSDLGKGDQKIEADPDFEGDETVQPIEDGSVTFTTAVTDCLRGREVRGDDAEAAGDDGDRRGPPQWVRDKHGEDHPANRGGGGEAEEESNGNGKGNGNGNGKPEGKGGGRP